MRPGTEYPGRHVPSLYAGTNAAIGRTRARLLTRLGMLAWALVMAAMLGWVLWAKTADTFRTLSAAPGFEALVARPE